MGSYPGENEDRKVGTLLSQVLFGTLHPPPPPPHKWFLMLSLQAEDRESHGAILLP